MFCFFIPFFFVTILVKQYFVIPVVLIIVNISTAFRPTYLLTFFRCIIHLWLRFFFLHFNIISLIIFALNTKLHVYAIVLWLFLIVFLHVRGQKLQLILVTCSHALGLKGTGKMRENTNAVGFYIMYKILYMEVNISMLLIGWKKILIEILSNQDVI